MKKEMIKKQQPKDTKELVFKKESNNNNTALKKAGAVAGKELELTLNGELVFRAVWENGARVEGKYTPCLSTEQNVSIPILEDDDRLADCANGVTIKATVSEYQGNFFIGVTDWEIAE